MIGKDLVNSSAHMLITATEILSAMSRHLHLAVPKSPHNRKNVIREP